MNRKSIIMMTLLTVVAISSLAYGRAPRLNVSPDFFAFGMDHQLGTEMTAMAQRSQLRECIYKADLARKHAEEFTRSATHSRLQLVEVQAHLKEVQLAVAMMLEDHSRFIANLTEKQWTAAKEPITRLEFLRATINAQLQGIDYELQMPAPQPKVLVRYSKKIDKDLKEWQKLHKQIGRAMGMEGRI